MGNGSRPGPVDSVANPVRLDDGTQARIASPSPGPVGLDAQSGGPSQARPSLGDQVVTFPRRRVGERVGDGECFALADRALRGAGAKSASDYGRVTPDADYVWGQAVAVADLRPGDIIQFRNYRYDRTVVVQDGNTRRTNTDFQTRPHHTAVVDSVDGDGAVTVLEQNVPRRGSVTRNQLFFTDVNTQDGNTTTTITVQGTVWFYRPEAR